MHSSCSLVAFVLRCTLAFQSLCFLSACGSAGYQQVEEPIINQSPPISGERTWLGPTMWGNRLQDWRFVEGRIECVTPLTSKFGWLPMRTAHELARRVDARQGAFLVSASIELLTPSASASGDALGGLLIGVGEAQMDPRSAAVVHRWAGKGAGVLVGVDARGVLHVRDHGVSSDQGEVTSEPLAMPAPKKFLLQVSTEQLGPGRVRLNASALDPETSRVFANCSRDFETSKLCGNVALLSHPGSFHKKNTPARYGFRQLTIGGAGSLHDKAAGVGAILGSQYTVSKNVLKLTAQLMPMGEGDPLQVHLETWNQGAWTPLAETNMQLPGWTASFRVPDWDASRSVPYRLRYDLPGAEPNSSLLYTWEGSITAQPAQDEELVVAVLNCNHLNSRAIGTSAVLEGAPDQTAPNDWVQGMWFPHAEVSQAVSSREPDLLFFAGDQIYNVGSPTYADLANIQLDYLYKWYLFLWAFRDLTADTPCVTIPDDHDVYQGNLWGAGGARAKEFEHTGGYVQPAEFIRLVERTQTSHLPDPHDPTPVEQGIGVYYCQLNWGGVSFAILEDRKFKSGCGDFLPDELRTTRAQDGGLVGWDPSISDSPELQLLGKRQEQFLEAWAKDWDGVDMKAVLSQSPFAGLTTHNGPNLVPTGPDLDANAWPQSARRRALTHMRAARAVHITGDQHLAIVAQHGIDEFGDGPWSFSAPSIANFHPRAWAPGLHGPYRSPPLSEYTGNFLDAFGNKISVAASANPGSIDRAESPSDLYDRMPGFGVVIFDKQSQRVTFECWPRGVDPNSKDAWQYAGWPISVDPR